MGNQEKLQNQIFELKFTSKSLVRESKKCQKEQTQERMKVKKAIEKGNLDGARIYAQNAIRKKTEELNYLRLSSRLDAVVARLDTQAKMNVISKSMTGIVKALDSALASNNLLKLSQTMDQFEQQFVNMEVQSEFVNNAMQGSTALSTPEDEVNSLLYEVADEHKLELSIDMPQASSAKIVLPQQEAEADAEADLNRRLAELKSRG